MTTPAFSPPPQFDYTSRDFLAIRDELIARIQDRVPEWTASDPADMGVALVEAFAYLGDMVSYYLDRVANESTLSTATQRTNVIALARYLGYEPTGYTPSKVTLTFTNTSTSTGVTLPAGTVVQATVERDDFMSVVPFETDAAVTIAANGTNTVTATQGVTVSGTDGYGEVLGTSTGQAYQAFLLAQGPALVSSVQVYVYDGVVNTPWWVAQHLVDYGPLDTCHAVQDDGNGNVTISFGDGVSGKIPDQGQVVKAVYRVGGGVVGNVVAGAINEIVSIPGVNASTLPVLLGTLSVINDAAAYGGADPEDTDSIRRNAPDAFRAVNRAVTLQDYESIALQYNGVGKARAVAGAWTAPTVYVAPYRSAGTAEERPGYVYSGGVWSLTTEMTSLKNNVKYFFTDKILAGVTVTVTEPTYTRMIADITVDLRSTVLQSDAETEIRTLLTNMFSYDNIDFGARAYPTDVIGALTGLWYVNTVTVNQFHANGGSGVGTYSAASNEIIYLLNSDLTVSLTGGIAYL